jgi:hypothetical protein
MMTVTDDNGIQDRDPITDPRGDPSNRLANAGAGVLLSLVISIMLLCAFALPRSVLLNSIYGLSKPRTLVEWEQEDKNRMDAFVQSLGEKNQISKRIQELEDKSRGLKSELAEIKDGPVPPSAFSIIPDISLGVSPQGQGESPSGSLEKPTSSLLGLETPDRAAVLAQNAKNQERRDGLSKEINEIEQRLSNSEKESNSNQEVQKILQTGIEQMRKDMLEPERNRYFLSIEQDTDHIYLVLRAIALGGIGAFASFMAQIVPIRQRALHRRFRMNYPMIFAVILIGSIVAIAVVGAFFTKQLTIFDPGEQTSKVPDFWRVTIVGLLAGAFADRIFAATTSRVDRYLGEEPLGPPA